MSDIDVSTSAEKSKGSSPPLLGLSALTAIVVGSMIGSGIFIAPSLMAKNIAAPGIYLGLWLLAGVFTLLGAFSYGELAAMMPEAGGYMGRAWKVWTFTVTAITHRKDYTYWFPLALLPWMFLVLHSFKGWTHHGTVPLRWLMWFVSFALCVVLLRREAVADVQVVQEAGVHGGLLIGGRRILADGVGVEDVLAHRQPRAGGARRGRGGGGSEARGHTTIVARRRRPVTPRAAAAPCYNAATAMALRGFLFDLDGTLVDSERETAEAMARALRRGQGIEIVDYDRDFIVGRSWLAIYDSLAARYPQLTWTRAETIAATAALRDEVFAELGVTVLPGARAALAWTAAHPRALVTGSARAEVAQVLPRIGPEAVFAVVVAAEDVARSKPAPDGYQAAIAALGLAAHECLVVEDSVAGIAAGRAAGCVVVACRAGNFAGWDQSAAHRVIDTLDELTPALVAELSAHYGSAMGAP